MLRHISRARLIAAWCAALIVIAVCGVAAGASASIGNGAVLLVACFVPPAVMLLLWRAPEPTVAEMLHSVDAAP
jgi:hypothetical protein